MIGCAWRLSPHASAATAGIICMPPNSAMPAAFASSASFSTCSVISTSLRWEYQNSFCQRARALWGALCLRKQFCGGPSRPYESALQWPAAAAAALLLWQSPYAGLVRGFFKVCVAAPCTTSVTACGRQRLPGWQQGKTWGLGPLDKRRSFFSQTVRPRQQDQRAVSGRHTLTGTLWCMVLRCPCCLFKQ